MRTSNKLFTTQMVADKLGFTPDYIRRLIMDGKIKAKKLGSNWVMEKKDFAHIKRQRCASYEKETV